jgi:hypothetical protein
LAVKPVRKIKLFFCYAHEDDALREQLARHLSPLRRVKHITAWFDRDIQAGTDWEHEIERQLDTANIILLLVSADFIDSDYCYSVEMQRALEKHQAGTACVIPIILRPVDWEETPIGTLQALPTGKKPVTLWANQDEAWLDVVQGIRKVVRTLLPKHMLSRHETGILYSEEIIQQPATRFSQKTSPTPPSSPASAFSATARMQPTIVPPDRNRQRTLKRRKADFDVILQEGVPRDTALGPEPEVSIQDLSFFKDPRRRRERELEELRPNKKKRIMVRFVVVLLLIAGSVGIFSIIQYSVQNVSNATATAQAEANATALAMANTLGITYPPKNTAPVIDDPLQDNSKGNNWEIDDPSNGNCKFINRTYDIDTDALEWCRAENTDFTNFIYEVQMKIVKGDGGGILFGNDLSSIWRGYYFAINQDGSYSVQAHTDKYDAVLARGSSRSIRRGLNQTNVVAAVVYGRVIELYVNHQRIAVVGNSNPFITFTHGRIGVVVIGSSSEQTEVIFQNAKVWKL